MARRQRTRNPEWFTWTVWLRGAYRTITWRDSELSGDAVLIAAFLEDAEYIPAMIDPVPYDTDAGWKADPFVAQYVLRQYGRVLCRATNIRPMRRVPGRIY